MAMSTVASGRTNEPPVVTLRPTGGALRRLRVEKVVRIVLGSAALVSVLTTVGIVLSLAEPTIEFFSKVSPAKFFGGANWSPLFDPPGYGVWAPVVASLLVTTIAISVAVPFGLGAAFYLSEYAKPRVRKVLKPILEILAGIPTVVFGFFALNFVNPYLVKKLWPVGDVGTFSVLAAGLVMGMMILPTVASLSEDAMSAVPQSLRNGAYALAATKREVCLKVVFRAAISGIVAAVVLAISRALGETMIVLLAAGNEPKLSVNPGEGMQTMTGFIGSAASGDLPVNSLDYKTIFAVGSLLFVFTLLLNTLSMRIVRRFREVYE